MSEIPDFIRKAIEAQGSVQPDEVLEGIDKIEDDEPLLPPPTPKPDDEQGILPLGSIKKEKRRK